MLNARCSWLEEAIQPAPSSGHTGARCSSHLACHGHTWAGPSTSLRVCCVCPGLAAFPDPCPGSVPDRLATSSVQPESSRCELTSFLRPSEGSLCARHWPLLFTCVQLCNPQSDLTKAGAGVRCYEGGHRGAEGCGHIGRPWTPCPAGFAPSLQSSPGALLLHVVQPPWPPACERLKFIFCFWTLMWAVLSSGNAALPSPCFSFSTYLFFTFYFQCHFLERFHLIVAI